MNNCVKVVSTASNKFFALNIAKNLKCDFIEAYIKKFSDSEISVTLSDSLLNHDAIIVKSITNPVNENLIELLLTIDAAKNTGAKKITIFAPYLCYSRHDSQVTQLSSNGFGLIAKLLEAAGANEIISLDMHPKFPQGFFRIRVTNIEIANHIVEKISNLYSEAKEVVIVSPDIGSIKRVEKISEKLKLNTAIIYKKRSYGDGIISKMEILNGDVRNKYCIIIDDIIDSAGTISKASYILKEEGARQIDVFASHAVLSKDAISKIIDSPINRVFITNSIEHKNLPSNKFEIIDLLEIIDISRYICC